MSETVHNEMSCSTFEALLDEALEGTLGEARMSPFQAHAATCPNCGPMFEFAQAGFAALHAVPEVEPPRYLVHNILAATTGVEAAAKHATTAEPGWRERVAGWVRPVFAPVLSPRFAMSTGMAFFSFMLVLNLVGVKLSDLRHLDLRPSAVQHAAQHTYYDTEARVVKYYENIRLVYQIQSGVRAIKDAERDSETNGTQEQKKPAPTQEKNDTSSDPDRRQQRQQQQYSHDLRERTLALYQAPSPLIEEPFSPQNRRDS
jgi:putative zinc finger protein